MSGLVRHSIRRRRPSALQPDSFARFVPGGADDKVTRATTTTDHREIEIGSLQVVWYYLSLLGLCAGSALVRSGGPNIQESLHVRAEQQHKKRYRWSLQLI